MPDPESDPEWKKSLWNQWTEKGWKGYAFERNCVGKHQKSLFATPESSYGPEGRGFESLTACQNSGEIG